MTKQGKPLAAKPATYAPLPAPFFALFVPADRPDLFKKACAAGADAVVIDFEDSIPSDTKPLVRRIPKSALPAKPPVPIYLRINGPGTPWYHDDVAFARGAGFAGVILPKVECPEQITTLRATLGTAQTIIALIETTLGLKRAEEIARAADRLAFGSLDLCEDLGCAHTRTALLPLRSALVQAARLAGRPAPLDGVTISVTDAAQITDDAAHASELGFGGKCLIHPLQLDPARAGFDSGQQDLDWARNVIAAENGTPAPQGEDAALDIPVAIRARRLANRRGARS
ncbi:CoA ester lyase [Alphaproteobacteria bacterium KMM 3653]|uniref:CoA ester lyase n=1 Tax=Harenicola maris TaxID=2841044 RepID=A0AAP2CQX3_9RHOB|nr:CoA ester lyase [Harenicola maris]